LKQTASASAAYCWWTSSQSCGGGIFDEKRGGVIFNPARALPPPSRPAAPHARGARHVVNDDVAGLSTKVNSAGSLFQRYKT
jgi:hypothetical protein